MLRLCKRRPGCDPAVTRLCSRVVEKLQTFCPESMRIQSKKLKIWRNTLKSSEKDADAVKRFCWYVCLVGSRSGVRNLATPHMVPQVSGVSSVPFLHISLGESHRNSYVCQCPCMSLIQAGHSSSTKQASAGRFLCLLYLFGFSGEMR